MNTYIGLDLGTSMLKAIAIDDSGKTLAKAAKEIPLISHATGWAEQSCERWWSSALEVLHLIGTKIDVKRVKGIGLSGQMHGLVLYGADNSVLRRAIVWMDKRSQAEAEAILERIGRNRLYSITGNPIFTGFLFPSLLWVKKHEPEIFKKTVRVSSPKDYIAYRLTGNLRTEPTDALATAAFDYKKNRWSEKIVTGMGIDLSLFPDIQPTKTPYGEVSKKVSRITGIPEGIPVFGGSDQSMAAMGCGLIKEGQSAIAISTGGQFLTVAKKGIIDTKRRLHTLNHVVDSVGLYMAATLSAGFSLRWFKDSIVEQEDRLYPKFLNGVGDVAPGSEGLFFLPFLAGERTPYFNANLRGAFIGLSLSHTRIHMVRSIIEGVAYSMRDCLTVFTQMNLPITKIILSGGGTKDPIWRQIIADVVGIPMETINIEDHSPFGAAIFAKFAQEGLEKLPEFYERVIQPVDFLYPNEAVSRQYDRLYQHYEVFAKDMNRYYGKRK